MADGVINLKLKDDVSKNLKNIENSFKGLHSSVSSIAGGLKSALTGAFAIAGIGSAIALMKSAVNEFSEAEKSNMKLALAVRNNPLIDGTGLKALKEYADSVQALSIYDSDLIKDLMAQAASTGYSADMIKKLSMAAANYASGAGIEYADAFSTLQKTLTGTSGALGKADADVKKLTASQLKQGKALDEINKKYKDMAIVIANTSYGKIEQFKNLFNDMLESFGAPLAKIGTLLLDKLKPSIRTITEWLDKHSKGIVDFIISIPEIIKTSFAVIGNFFKAIFDPNTLANFLIKTMEAVGTTFKNIFIDLTNQIFSSINKLLNELGKVPVAGALFKGKSIDLLKKDQTTADAWGSVANVYPDAIKGATKDNWEKLLKLVNKILGVEEDKDNGFGDKTSSGKPIDATGLLSSSVSLASLLGIDTSTISTLQSFVSTLSSLAEGLGSSGDWLTGILTSLSGVIDSIVVALGGWMIPLIFVAIGLLKTLLTPLLGILQPIIGALQWVGEWIGKLLLPILDALSPTIYYIAQALMSLMGPIIQILVPVIQFIASILDTIVTPIIKGIAYVLVMVSGPLKWLGDLFTWCGKAIKNFGDFIVSFLAHPFDSSKWSQLGIGAFVSTAIQDAVKQANAIWTGTAQTQYGTTNWDDFVNQLTSSQADVLAGATTSTDTTSSQSASYQSTEIINNNYNYGNIIGTSLDELTTLIAEKMYEIERRNYSR